MHTPYLPDPGLVAAVEVALDLQMPLLVTGEPGTGKTQLAYWVAQQKLAEAHYGGQTTEVLRFNTKTNSVAKDLFYRYDAIRHFRDGQKAGEGQKSPNPLQYVHFEALGKAVLAQGSKRFVVLVDEIDKAPRDFPNDLLFEFDEMAFRVEEAGQADFEAANREAGFWKNKPEIADLQLTRVDLENGAIRWYRPGSARPPKPVLILTSNSEKNLPDAFLRRCVFYHIGFPEDAQLARIIEAHFPGAYDEAARLKIAAYFSGIRNKGLRKSPATAELVRWVELLKSRNIDIAEAAQIQGKSAAERNEAEKTLLEKVLVTYAVLAKNKDDIDKIGRL